jgi:hypothetical protein
MKVSLALTKHANPLPVLGDVGEIEEDAERPGHDGRLLLVERLNPGGRLAAIVGKMPVMQALITTRSAVEGTTTEVLFETVAKPLRGFRARESFTF